MTEILSHMRSNGLEPSTLELDGKVHRYKVDAQDSKESACYCGFQNYLSSSGAPFNVLRYGNFRTGEVHQYQTEGNYSPKDLTEIKQQLAKAKKKAEEEREREQERAATDCQGRWEGLRQDGSSGDYLSAKGLSGLFGARSSSDPFGGVSIYVPMRDVHGKIWSLQKIQPNGQKFFHPGARVAGCFHQIGELTDEQPIRICEGFATGATIHLATGEAVFVAFQSGNLLPVAQDLRKLHAERSFVICGDDDKWTVKPSGESWNPGREKAEDAAKRILGAAVFPKFEDAKKGETDFDDLRQKEGIEKVKEQLCEARAEKHYIIPLGYNEGDYFLLSNVNPQIQRLSAGQLNSSGLCRLQPLAYWEALYPAKNEGVSWARAADEIMQSCHRRGIFKPDRVRGRGVWIDERRVIYHMGTRLSEGGRVEHDLHRNSLKSRYIYNFQKRCRLCIPNLLQLPKQRAC